MPIRTAPFDQIDVAMLRDLIVRQIREERTLDFKQTLTTGDSGKLDFLQDVTAMANASGGTIVYGAVEGEGDDRGLIVGLAGLAGSPDALTQSLEMFLRDCVDERIHGVLHRAVALDDGKFAYVVRIPASPLAPHMVKAKSHRERFYLRGTVSNDPMNARQVKELALRSASAIGAVRELIRERNEELGREVASRSGVDFNADETKWAKYNGLQFHVLPLYPPVGGYDLGDLSIERRIAAVNPYASGEGFGVTRWALEGCYQDYAGVRPPAKWVLFLRSGGLEYGAVGIAAVNALNHAEASIPFDIHEHQLLKAVDAARGLADDGLLPLPVAIGLHLRTMKDIYLEQRLGMYSSTSSVNHSYQDVTISPEIVSDWGEVPKAMRRIFDAVWQAWGEPRSPSYDQNGNRIR